MQFTPDLVNNLKEYIKHVTIYVLVEHNLWLNVVYYDNYGAPNSNTTAGSQCLTARYIIISYSWKPRMYTYQDAIPSSPINPTSFLPTPLQCSIDGWLTNYILSARQHHTSLPKPTKHVSSQCNVLPYINATCQAKALGRMCVCVLLCACGVRCVHKVSILNIRELWLCSHRREARFMRHKTS